ncbi:zinc-binding alcohol dehydrogenase family protein [Microbulbifer elongatus]|uniref:Zinc-type alcohol dehydrogenase-like protein n=1 Tax=Microbulbifer elongatus TaxID=86173 RepID=A0ABT1P5K7_9GAMM|nr:zinc-binding alcohol dehydrogenase family protein [Microbulbifer elongatus]MCQ3830419.1 zinc-binding alcohol dehydrogenase family protein [Microbulbifer elongatus]
MKAVAYTQSLDINAPGALVDVNLPMPHATGRDLLVKVRAISVNPVDTKIRASVAPDKAEHKVLGWDAVGEVVAAGDEVSLFEVGDSVWYAGDLTRQGSNAEYQLVDERIVGIKPASLSDTQAAAMPLTAITAWELLFDRLGFVAQLPAGVKPYAQVFTDTGEAARILIVGAAGGVGSILIQLAKKLTGATVIGTASREKSRSWVMDLGADHVINHHQPMLPQLQALGLNGVTHVISLTHTGEHFDQLVEVLAPQGKLALIDDPQEGLDVLKLKAKSISLHWEFMYTRSMFSTADMQKQHDLLTALSQLIDKGIIRSTQGEHYGAINAENLIRAHKQIESNSSVGKIVLEGFSA